MSLSKEEIRHVARLARLELNQDETEEFTWQINEILSFVEKLNQLDTTGIEPMAHAISVNNVFRKDQKQASLPIEEALANAPERIEDFFKVPKTLEE